MNERDPNTTELLSAYLDGELDADERRDLERRLAEDPKLALELETLRATSTLLRSWTVDAPPAPAWVRRGAPARRSWTRGALAAACAACFVAGVGLGLSVAPRGVPPAPQAPAESVVAPAEAAGSITPAQADGFLQEVTASAVRTRLLDAVRDGQEQQAEMLYKELTGPYANTQAAREIQRDPRFSLRLATSGGYGRR